MTIGPYGASAFSAQRSTDLFRSIKGDLSATQAQLSTGRAATTYSGLGAGGAGTSLALRSRLSTLDTYGANIQDGTLRLGLMSAGLDQMGKLADTLREGLGATTGGITAGVTNTGDIARAGFSAMVDILNTDLNGRYLFSGRAADTRPVAAADLMLAGDATHAGLSTLITQRKAADAGPDGMGRLMLTASGTAVSLAEEAAGLPFGMKLVSSTSSGAGVTATLAGTPPAADLSVGAQPSAGDTIEITLQLPDGTQEAVRLVAGAASSSGSDTGYALGATEADTATNIAAALAQAVKSVAATALPSASAMQTATDFFAADGANPPARVAGPPYDTATATTPGTAGNTVIWYAGDTSGAPRDTAPLRIGDNRTIGLGAEANEPVFRQALAAFAALAGDSFSASDPNATARYAALTSRAATGIAPGSLSGITKDLSIATAALKTASSNLAVTKNQTQDTLGHIENADPNEAAVRLMATQTRLQASYQVTATLQKLSLVNYL